MILKSETKAYQGFEQGPIRPPSEADSLLIRITRNCPWNRCAFCPVYKGTRFSIRPVAHVRQDIDAVARHVDSLRKLSEGADRISRAEVQAYGQKLPPDEIDAFYAAFNWFVGGMRSVFLQDANSLIIKPADLIEILRYLKARFPWISRITSYARSHTIDRISDSDLKAIRDAGLNRIHIGMESGSNAVLKLVEKGATQEIHIRAGLKVKQARMELSEYVMPGLGGKSLSDVHALETAEALNRINPDFIRLRTLAVPDSVGLFQLLKDGRFEKLTDRQTTEEILRFIEALDGITSFVRSDHILNLLQEVEGRLPEDRERMTAPLRTFLAMDSENQCLFQVGRRLGIFSSLQDMRDVFRMEKAKQASRQLGITPENVDAIIDELMKRFI